MSIEKNKKYIVDIVDNGIEGEGIAKIDNFIIFVPNAIKGEKIKILIVKVNKNYGYGKILDILIPAKCRNNDIDCNTYKRCGGCNLRHIKYEDTLKLKKYIVENTLKKALNRDIIINNIIGMDNPYFYRNKLQYPVGIVNNEPVMGVYANRTHDIIPTEKCFIQDEKSQIISLDIFNFLNNKDIPYDERTRNGTVRHIIVKVGKNTGEIMIIIVVNDDLKCEKELVDYLVNKYRVTTIVKNINKCNTNVILGKQNIVLYGNGYIEDKLGEYRFLISPLSFYQINPVQTEKLYNTAISMAKLGKNEVVYDLYCGIGTISIFVAKYVKKVYGIEIVNEAIDYAKKNAEINNVHNVEFMAGNVEIVLPNLLNKEIPDVVFVDPPRKGLDSESIKNIMKIRPKKIIYISCNPATLARDLKIFDEVYNINEVQPVDMFPFTSHVECVSVLELK